MAVPIRILGIAPYEGMRSLMQKEALRYPQITMDVYTGDLSDGVEIVKLREKDLYDAVISRGGTAELIREVTNLPVITIPFSVYDILRAMKMAESYGQDYAIVGFPPITNAAHILCDLLQSPVNIITVHSGEEVSGILDDLMQNGCRCVVSDMVAHTKAREKGMNAFLITSGSESVQQALEQALTICSVFRDMRAENRYLKTYAQETDCHIVVMGLGGDVEYTTLTDPSVELLNELKKQLPNVPSHHSHRFIYSHGQELYQVSGRRVDGSPEGSVMFRYQPYQIPLHTKNSGIRTLTRTECSNLFLDSFFAVSGSMGEMEAIMKRAASTRKPVMILGEEGTGKIQLARALYLNSSFSQSPLITIDCALINEKNWNYLFNHESSPLNGKGTTVYFQHIESINKEQMTHLLSSLTETNLTGRQRLIFSSDHRDMTPLHENAADIISQAGCITLTMPPLRSRSDEIPSLAALYLARLNIELGKQIIGPDSRSLQLLQEYDWPGNYSQFKKLLYELAIITDSSYIRGAETAEALGKERSLSWPGTTQSRISAPKKLGDITLEAILSTVAACGGNQSAAARQLGISRSTLWRYLSNAESGGRIR